ncbi:MAG: IS200/IS605 family transposase [Bacteroidales bacterium]|nr:IS200/IS605 family transposase [Bacteroidales bacterium]
MANSFIQAYVHYVFTVKGRINFLKQENNDELQKYITGIVQNRNCKMLAINNMPDHVHIFLGQHPSYSISKTIQEIKSVSSKFINEKNWYKSKFCWQSGYGAFTYSHSQIDNVIKHIINQQQHHKKRTFRDEYIEFLNKFGIEYNEKYLFEFYD